MNRRRAIAAVTVAMLGLSICVAATNQPAVAAVASKVKVFLPSLPHRSVLHPEVFDEDGCTRLAEEEGGGVKCGPKEDGKAAEHRRDEKTPRRLLGFSGPLFADEVDGQGIALLENSVNVSSSGKWQAQGLIRNERTEPVGDVTVTATLLGGSGEQLGMATATTSLGLIRSGEPAPFVAVSEVPANRVAKVVWSMSPAAPQAVHRKFDVYTVFEYAHGASTYQGRERTDAPYPYALGTGFRNLETEVARNPRLVVAWLNDDGKVLAVMSSPLKARMKPDFAPNTPGHFEEIRVQDAIMGPALSSASKLLWVVAE